MQVLKAPQAQVLTALQSVAGIVERRHTLPILANVLLRKHGEMIQLITSDLEIQIRTTAQLGGDEGDFSTTVFPVIMAQAIDRAPTGNGPFHGTICADTP